MGSPQTRKKEAMHISSKPLRSALLLVIVCLVALGSGCIREGTLVTVQTVPGEHPRALDQAVLGDAIDMAFANIDVGMLSGALMAGGPTSAYVEVTSPFPMDPEVAAYVRDQATLAVGRLGVGILEVRQTLQRPNPERLLEVVETEYPDVGARVLVMVSMAGVDEVYTDDDQDSHGSTEPSRVLLGRFKATLAITPRKLPFTASAQTLEGRTTYPLSRGNFVDGR